MNVLPRRLTASRRLPVLLLPLFAVVALATACGGSSKPSSSPTTAPGSGSGAAGFAASRAKFTSCLEAHGVPASQATQSFGFRRGSGGSGSTSSTSTPPTTTATYSAAFQACRSDLPTRGSGGFQNSAAGRAYLQCLQLHGVTVPSTSTGAAPGGAGGGGFNSNPNFQAARQACASLAPTGGPTSSTSAAA